ncbi:MAG TPA: hypothetical protein V6C82_01605 [Chroococcales cyanobacterium]|jgi:hypothetical protein
MLTNHRDFGTSFVNVEGIREMGLLSERKIEWVLESETLKTVGTELVIRPIIEKDFDVVSGLYRKMVPELVGTKFDWIYDIEGIKSHVGINLTLGKMDRFIYVVESVVEKEIVGMVLLTLDRLNLSIEMNLVTLKPEFRSIETLRSLYLFIDTMIVKSGVEYGTVTVFTTDLYAPELIEDLGWKVRGVFPGMLLVHHKNDLYYRIHGTVLDKFFGKGIERMIPEIKLTQKGKEILNLTERVMVVR